VKIMDNIKTKIWLKVTVSLAIIFFAFCLTGFCIALGAFRHSRIYYKFRGWVQFLGKNIRLDSANLKMVQSIKLVKFKGKWYLDGDLPNCKFLDYNLTRKRND